MFCKLGRTKLGLTSSRVGSAVLYQCARRCVAQYQRNMASKTAVPTDMEVWNGRIEGRRQCYLPFEATASGDRAAVSPSDWHGMGVHNSFRPANPPFPGFVISSFDDLTTDESLLPRELNTDGFALYDLDVWVSSFMSFMVHMASQSPQPTLSWFLNCTALINEAAAMA